MRTLLLLLLGALSALAQAAAPPGELTVFAAASLTDALGAVGQAYTRSGGAPVRFSFAASSTLARQIEAGAAADVFVSADADWMDDLAQHERIVPATRRDIAGNELVLIAPADSRAVVHLTQPEQLLAALGAGRLATGDPDAVPVGRYARAALSSLGLWPRLADQLARAENVRVALALVARGEAPLGIVYATDARAEPRVRVLDRFPRHAYPPITYPAAVVRGAAAEAGRFIDFLGGARGQAILRQFGFSAAPPPAAVGR